MAAIGDAADVGIPREEVRVRERRQVDVAQRRQRALDGVVRDRRGRPIAVLGDDATGEPPGGHRVVQQAEHGQQRPPAGVRECVEQGVEPVVDGERRDRAHGVVRQGIVVGDVDLVTVRDQFDQAGVVELREVLVVERDLDSPAVGRGDRNDRPFGLACDQPRRDVRDGDRLVVSPQSPQHPTAAGGGERLEDRSTVALRAVIRSIYP